MFYRLYISSSAAGANQVHFDFFNASGSASDVEIWSVAPVVIGSTAVSGAVAVDLFLTRTTAIGTGGTGATYLGATLTASTFGNVDNEETLNANITARLRPTGGATAGAIISTTSVLTEELSGGNYVPSRDLVRNLADEPKLIVKQGTGIRVVQGSVASVGNLAFNVLFKVIKK